MGWPMKGSCKACGAPIVMATTEKRRRVPLDQEPVEGGSVSIGSDGVARVVSPIPGQKLLMPHSFTCAARKKRKADRVKGTR